MATVPHIARKDHVDHPTRRRIWAIVGASSGNLVEWYDFYVYSFTALYFASEFFPKGNQTTQLLNAAGVFGAGRRLVRHREVVAQARIAGVRLHRSLPS